MELNVENIRLLPWWDTDIDIINSYLPKIKAAIKRIADYYRTNELFIDNCVVLPLTYVLKFIIENGVKFEKYERGMIVYSDEYAVIILNDEEYDDEYIDDKEACFIIEPYIPYSEREKH